MERDFKPPTSPPEASAPQPAPGSERVKRPPKKEKFQPTEKAKTPEDNQPNAAEKPPKQKFGAKVVNLLFGRRRPEAAPPPAAAESAAPAESDLGPTTERAGRMRRFARRVISFTLGEAASETTRAKAEGAANPLNTEPLIDAAEDLREATDSLDDTLHKAEEKLVYQGVPTPESSMSSPDFGGSHGEYSVAEHLVKHVERLEAKVGASRKLALAALGLGVVAVLVTGYEHFAGKRVEKTVRKSGKAQKALEEQVKTQQQEFVALQKEQAAHMNRARRQDYYERLSEFTHQQASSTREANKELQHGIEAALPVPEPLPPIEKQPSPVQSPEKLLQPVQPEPLRRVETADTVERGSQTGNAGTGFFGGGMSGVGGRIQQAFGTVTGRPTQPMTEEEISADARRRARLASNAWLYSAGFVVAVAALVLSLIFSV